MQLKHVSAFSLGALWGGWGISFLPLLGEVHGKRTTQNALRQISAGDNCLGCQRTSETFKYLSFPAWPSSLLVWEQPRSARGPSDEAPTPLWLLAMWQLPTAALGYGLGPALSVL